MSTLLGGSSASNPTEFGQWGPRVNRGRALNRRRQRGLQMVQGLRKDRGLGVLHQTPIPQSRKPPITTQSVADQGQDLRCTYFLAGEILLSAPLTIPLQYRVNYSS